MRLHSVRFRFPIWLMLIALLAPPASAGSGRYVCLRGMPEVGASCPMCHGDRAANANPCCKWIESAPMTPDATVGSATASPSLAPLAGLAPSARDIMACADAGTPMRAGPLAARSSPPRSTILRL
jgi:hypothetical protein